MEPNITIVTAFFDIGRGDWSNGPSYLKRTTDQYFEAFERLLTLDNQIIVYTSNDLLHRFYGYNQQKDNLIVVGLADWRNIWSHYRPKIQKVMDNPEFKKMLHQPWNPEYWSVDYVMVNMLKSYFVDDAIDEFEVNDLVAWIDFGYCREWEDVPTNVWNYSFDPEKMHFFTIKPNIASSMNIYDVITCNDVIITGCHIVGGKDVWYKLKQSIYNNLDNLLKFNIIDDDQSFLFMYCLEKQDEVEIRKIEPNDWFCIFRNFNNSKGLNDAT